MEKTYACKNKIFTFGIDPVCGVFLQFFNEVDPLNITIINWSEFEPFNRRFTYDAIQEGIKNGELLESEFKEICKVPLEDYNVYFSGIMVTDDAPADFEMPKGLMQKHLNCKPFRVRTLGDYYKVLKMFRNHVTFSKVSWYPYSKRSTGVLYEFTNDIEQEDGITSKPKLYERSEPFVSPIDGTQGVIVRWFDKEGKEHAPRTCSDCEDPMWDGHVINDGVEYYCTDCIKKHYTKQEREDMYNADTQYYIQWEESDLKEDFDLVYEDMEMYMIAKKDDSSNGYYGRGHCFQCKMADDKVTLDSELSRSPEEISIVQFEEDFKEMSKEDYELYVRLCEDGEDPTEAVLKKYLD